MKPSLNLASRIYLNRRALFIFYGVLLAMLSLILVTQVGYWMHAATQKSQVQLRLAELEDQLGLSDQTTKYTEKEFSTLLDKIAFANEVIAKEVFHWTGLLSRLEEVAHPRVRIVKIQPNFKEGKLVLAGEAKSVADLREFLDSLLASKYFADAYLLRQSEIKPAGAGGVNRSYIEFDVRVESVAHEN